MLLDDARPETIRLDRRIREMADESLREVRLPAPRERPLRDGFEERLRGGDHPGGTLRIVDDPEPFALEDLSVVEAARTIQECPPRDARRMPPRIAAIVATCLAKDPALRPKSANALSRELDWCQSADDWNRDKARYWWHENEKRLEERYGLSSMARVSPGEGRETMEIRLDGR